MASPGGLPARSARSASDWALLSRSLSRVFMRSSQALVRFASQALACAEQVVLDRTFGQSGDRADLGDAHFVQMIASRRLSDRSGWLSGPVESLRASPRSNVPSPVFLLPRDTADATG